MDVAAAEGRGRGGGVDGEASDVHGDEAQEKEGGEEDEDGVSDVGIESRTWRQIQRHSKHEG